MRKRIISPSAADRDDQHEWLDLAELAEVEVTSEDPEFPIEHALLPTESAGWRAGGPGPQTIRLIFPDPQPVHLIHLEFDEAGVERTQEFQLSWCSDLDQPPTEILRQQWNFSPTGATRQTEEIRVDLAGVALLELTITPDIGGGRGAGHAHPDAAGLRDPRGGRPVARRDAARTFFGGGHPRWVFWARLVAVATDLARSTTPAVPPPGVVV